MTALIIIGAICLLNCILFVYLYKRVKDNEKWKPVEKKQIKEEDFINFS